MKGDVGKHCSRDMGPYPDGKGTEEEIIR
jgi:hypothetical protein